jgi:MFS family permease
MSQESLCSAKVKLVDSCDYASVDSATPEGLVVPVDQSVRGPAARRALKMVTVSWIFGSVWVTATAGAPYSLFARHLSASEFQIGLLAALPFIASFISLPASLLTERTGARKKIFLACLYAQRLLWIPIALVPLWIVSGGGADSSRNAVLVFLALTFLMHCTGAAGGPAWLSWMADIVPSRLRGNYFSRRRCWGILSSIPVALLVGWIVDRCTGATSDSYTILRCCAFIFAFSAIFGVIDIHMFQYVPDVPMPPRKSVPIMKMLAGPLRDREFLWFGGFIATLTFALSFMGQFVTLYLIDKVHVSGIGIQLMLLVAPGIAQLATLSAWGRAVDRLGKKPVLAIASLGLVPVGLGWCLMGHGWIWLGYLLSAAGAALWAGVEVANLNLVLDFAGSKQSGNAESSGTNYVAVNSIIINVAGCLGGLSSGVIASLLRNWHWDPGILGLHNWTFYEILFALSGILRLLAVVLFLPHIHEKGAGTATETLRFMTTNIYNNLFTAVLAPWRMLSPTRPSPDPKPVPAPTPYRRAA